MLRTKAAFAAVLIPVLISAAAVGSAQSSAPPATDATASGSDSAPGGSDAATAAAEAGGQPDVATAAEAEPGSGEGITIGYLSNLEAVPIVHVISDGIRAQAKRAGVKLIFCDGNGDNAKALNCMKLFKNQGAQGILKFQHDTKASPSICDAGPEGVPVFAIDIPQPPCQTSFMGVDNSYGGFVAGEKAGQYGRRQLGLQVRRMDLARAADHRRPNEQRMGGYRKGFQPVCPAQMHDLQPGRLRRLDRGARTIVTDILTTLPGKSTSSSRRSTTRASTVRSPPPKSAGRPIRRLGHLARGGRRHHALRHQDQPELARLDGDLPGEVRLGRHPLHDRRDQGEDVPEKLLTCRWSR